LTSDGLLPIEGPKLLEEALKSGTEVTDIFLRRPSSGPSGHLLPEGEGQLSSMIPLPPGEGGPKGRVRVSGKVYELDSTTFKSIQSTETSQGIVALVRPPTFSLQKIFQTTSPLIVVLG